MRFGRVTLLYRPKPMFGPDRFPFSRIQIDARSISFRSRILYLLVVSKPTGAVVATHSSLVTKTSCTERQHCSE
jgi:hypothetical protein